MEPIVNKVAESQLLVLNLEDLWDGRKVAIFDLAPFLYEGLILREKPYREALRNLDLAAYEDAHVGIHCSTDAIIPTWAFMLAASKLQRVARSVTSGVEEDVRTAYFDRKLNGLDWDMYRDRMVVVKGCGSNVVPPAAYVQVVSHLQRVARKVMFGEPCSTVPVWRRPSTKEG